jgi:hypothetical protein
VVTYIDAKPILFYSGDTSKLIKEENPPKLEENQPEEEEETGKENDEENGEFGKMEMVQKEALMAVSN